MLGHVDPQSHLGAESLLGRISAPGGAEGPDSRYDKAVTSRVLGSDEAETNREGKQAGSGQGTSVRRRQGQELAKWIPGGSV